MHGVGFYYGWHNLKLGTVRSKTDHGFLDEEAYAPVAEQMNREVPGVCDSVSFLNDEAVKP